MHSGAFGLPRCIGHELSFSATTVRPTLNSTSTAIAVLTALTLSMPASAQKLYRCGNQFSQTPCSGEAVGQALPNGAIKATLGDGMQGGGATCGKALLKTLSLPDTHTAEIESATRGKAATIEFANQPIVARTFDVSIAMRNGLGSKVGTRSATCFVSEDEQRVLKLTPR